MRIPSFEVRSQRAIQYAACERVPPLMVIAGPNGTGKSTMLNALRSSAGWQDVLYLGPHRAMRRQHVQQRHLLSAQISFRQLLASPNTQGFDGIRLVDGARDPWSYDDSANYLKHALCQIELDRQQAIAAHYDRVGSISPGSLPDPWQPLRELTNSLLPHLKFERIDASNRDQVLCRWSVHGAETLVDLDDLSSGEKSVIQMFYPLLERRIKSILSEARSGEADSSESNVAILIDEPELHLHPNLQMKVMDYLRALARDDQFQVIVATHSPTIVENASSDELYLLRPCELVDAGSNQLVRVADNDEKLAVLRDVFGTTSNLTAMQPILVVEGPPESSKQSVLSDRKIYRRLHKGFDAVTLLSAGGKTECKALVRALNECLPHLSEKLRGFALLDRDLEAGQGDDSIKLLPVSMIENLLIDPESMWEAMQSVVEHAGLSSIEQVGQAIDEVLDSMEKNEIERRALAELRSACFRPHRPLERISDQLLTFSSALDRQYSSEAIQSARNKAADEVNSFRAASCRREHFDGKAVLKEFHSRHLHKTSLSRQVFRFEIARHAQGRKSVRSFFDGLFNEVLGVPESS